MMDVKDLYENLGGSSDLWKGVLPTAILLFLSILMGLMWCNRHPRYLPPGPYFPLQLLLKMFSNKRYLVFAKYALEYGPIYSFKLGNSTTVVLNNISMAKEALVKQAEVFSERYTGKAIAIASNGLKGSILMGNGEEHKELRRFGAHSFRSFGVGKRSLSNKINEEARHLVEAIRKEEGKPFDPVHVVSNAVSNIICSISFGDRYDYDDSKFQQLLDVLRKQTSQSPMNLVLLIFPRLVYVPPYNGQMKRLAFFENFITDILEKHRATLDPNDVRDIIDMFLVEVDQRKAKTSHDNVFDSSRVWRTIFDLFAAGSDTTSNSLLWAIAIFCHHPGIQEKMYQEIKEVLGTEKLPVYEDRHRLPYTQAVLLEIQRFRPVVPIVPHFNSCDATLGGYHIPKGSRVFIDLWSIHHDPEEWKDPELFLPERFLDSDQNVLNSDAHVPFSLGRRICLGETLAKMELFLFLTSLVQNFQFYVPEGKKLPSLEGISGITLSPEPYSVCAESRT